MHLERRLQVQVARNVHQHGAHLPGRRGSERLPYQLGNPFGAGHLEGRLGHRPKHAHVVDLLNPVAVQVGARHGSGHGHDGGVPEVCLGDPGQEVRGTGPVRGHADCRAPTGPRLPNRHERGTLFVPCADETNVVAVVEGVEHLRVARSDNAEHARHPLLHEGLDDGLSRGDLGHDLPYLWC